MANKITFQEFTDSFSNLSGETKTFSRDFVRNTFQLIREGLVNDGYANIKGLGIFRLQEVAAKTIKNPKTGKTTHIKAHNKVVFKPEKSLREKINEPYSGLSIKPVSDGSRLERKSAAEKVDDDSIFISKPESKKKKKTAKPAKKTQPAPVKKKEPALKPDITENNIFISRSEDAIPEKPDENDDLFIFSDNPEDTEKLAGSVMSGGGDNDPDDTRSMPAFVIKEKKRPSVWRWLTPLLMILILFWFIFYLPQSSRMDFSKLKERFHFLANDSMLITEAVRPGTKAIEDTLSTDYDSMMTYSDDDVFVAAPLPEKIIKKASVKEPESVEPKFSSPVLSVKEPVKVPVQKDEPFVPHRTPDEHCLIHTVMSGNTLWGLSKQYYERYAYWPNIYRKNIESLQMPDHLKPGMDLLIPELEGSAGELTKTDSARIAQGYYLAYRAYKKYNHEKAAEYLRVAKEFRTTVK